MKKLLQTKIVLIALFVAVPALAAGTAATVGAGNDDGSPAVVEPVDAQPAADREDDVAQAVNEAADDQDGDVEGQVKPKEHQSEPADTEEQDNEQVGDDDQGENEQADDDQGENDDDQGEKEDAQGDEDSQGSGQVEQGDDGGQDDTGDDQSDDQGGDD